MARGVKGTGRYARSNKKKKEEAKELKPKRLYLRVENPEAVVEENTIKDIGDNVADVDDTVSDVSVSMPLNEYNDIVYNILEPADNPPQYLHLKLPISEIDTRENRSEFTTGRSKLRFESIVNDGWKLKQFSVNETFIFYIFEK